MLGQRLDCLAITFFPIEYQHPLHANPIHQDRAQPLVTIWLGSVVLGDKPADDDAREAVHHREHRVEKHAADVLEVNIDTVRAGRTQALAHVARFVVDAGVEAELVHDVVALGLAARDAYSATAHDLRELPDHAADGTRGG